MKNKKIYLGLGVAIIVIGIAAFMAGRMIKGGVGPLTLFGGPVQDDGITILPAEELPKTPPEVEGIFVERQDNIIIIESDPPGQDRAAGSPVGVGGGQEFEVVITAETLIYHDTTEPPTRRPTGDDPRELQQTVEAGTLESLNNSQSMVMVWGRKSGDRIIAEVLVYSNPAYLQKP
jgi:hypothetical protein